MPSPGQPFAQKCPHTVRGHEQRRVVSAVDIGHHPGIGVVNREEKCDEALASGTAEYPVIQQLTMASRSPSYRSNCACRWAWKLDIRNAAGMPLPLTSAMHTRHALILEGHGVVVIATHVVVGTVPRRK